MKGLLILGSLALASCGETLLDLSSQEESKTASYELGERQFSAEDFGINAHRPTGEEGKRIFDKVRESGVRWARIDVSWDEIESDKGRFEWSKSDDPIRAASERGLNVYANIHNTPNWASGREKHNVPASSTSEWSRFCRQVAERYDGSHGQPKVTVFGIWNEPDGMGLDGGSRNERLETYANKILKPCYSAIKSVRKDSRVAAPDLASETEFLSDLLATAMNSIDIVSVHKYSNNPDGVVAATRKIRQIMKSRRLDDSKPLWLTETGWSTKGKSKCWFDTVSDSEQAERIPRLFEQLKAAGTVEKVFIYELKDDDNSGACQWGLVESNLRDKPAFAEVKRYMESLSKKDSPGDSGSSGRRPIRQPVTEYPTAKPQPPPQSPTAQPQPPPQSPTAQPQPQPTPSIPRGSYQKRCDQISVKNNRLFARCKDEKGKNHPSSLERPYECSRDIENSNGSLRCRK
jgi:hypothetical protein